MKLTKAISDRAKTRVLLYSNEDMIADSQIPQGPDFDLRMGPSSSGLQSEPLPAYPGSFMDGAHVRALGNVALVGVSAGGSAYRSGSGPASVPIGISAAASVVPVSCSGTNCHFDY